MNLIDAYNPIAGAAAWTGIVAALPAEVRCLGLKRGSRTGATKLGAEARVTLSGLGEIRAGSAAKRLMEQGASALMSWGIAGALDPALRSGDVLVPRVVLGRDTHYAIDGIWRARVLDLLAKNFTIIESPLLNSENPLTTVEQKREAHRRTGAVAVDMESAGIARAAALHGIPFLVIRTIADPAWRGLPQAALAAISEDGRLQPFSLLAALLKRPHELRELRALSKDFDAARASLARVWQAHSTALLATH